MRLAIAQHTAIAVIRAQPARDVFALAEGLAEAEGARHEWEASLAGVELR